MKVKKEVWIPNLRQVSIMLLGIVLLAFLVGNATFLWGRYQSAEEPVQIIPWSPGEESPYVCFAAMKGENNLLALSCLESTK